MTRNPDDHVFARDYDADYDDMPPNLRMLCLMLDKRMLMLIASADGQVAPFFDAMAAFEEAKHNMKTVGGIK